MRTTALASLALFLLVGYGQGQSPDITFEATAPRAQRLRWWSTGEYLLWRVKNGPNPVPLVTTGSFTGVVGFVGDQSSLGAATTRTLFGGNDLSYGNQSGGRLAFGTWFGCGQRWGAEASSFWLARAHTGFSAASDSRGLPLLSFPYQNLNGVEQHFVIAQPSLASFRKHVGTVSVDSSSQIWGTEFSGVRRVICRPCFSLDLLAGFAYRQLEEDLTIAAANTRFGTGVTFPNLLIHGATLDQFATENHFYGAHLSTRMSVARGRLSADVLSRISLGNTRQVVEVQGLSTSQNVMFGSTQNPFGIYAQPSNIGRRTRDEFSAIPELQLRLGWNFTERLRLTVGYDLLYWSNVVRPGDQIDRVIDTVNPGNAFGNINFNLPGTGGRPAPRFVTSDAWVQGVSVGLTWNW